MEMVNKVTMETLLYPVSLPLSVEMFFDEIYDFFPSLWFELNQQNNP